MLPPAFIKKSTLTALAVFLFFFSIPWLAAFAAEPLEILYSMKDGYNKVEDYSATFVREERIEGKLKPPEVINLEFKRPFMVRMNWLKGPKKGRSVVYVQGENQNRMLVRLEGLIGGFFKLLFVDPHGKMAMRGSRHPITQAGIGNLVDSLVSLTQKAEKAGDLNIKLLGEEVIDKRKVYLIERTLPAKKYESPRTLIYIDKELLLPIQILRFDEGGELYERYAYENLRINRDISPTVFSLQDPYKRRSAEEKAAVEQARKVVRNALDSYEKLNDYTSIFHKTERLANDTIQSEVYSMRYLKPSYLYFQIQQGKYKGTEIFYRPLKEGPGKMVVKPGGVMGSILSTINLDTISLPTDMELIRKNNRHLVQEMGIGYFLDRYHKDIEKGIETGDIFVAVSPRQIEQELGQQIELILKDRKKKSEYYAPRTLTFFSDNSQLPVNVKVFDEKGDLLENYRYSDLKINTGLTSENFEPQAPKPEPAPPSTVPAVSGASESN
jgi:outer membrane lipoprotein-sorting protein